MAEAQTFPRCGDAYGTFRIPVNTHRMAADQRSVLYFIQSLDLVKVGIATDLAKRVCTFQLGNPHPLDVKSRAIPRALAKQVEQQAHMALAEWDLYTCLTQPAEGSIFGA